MIFEPEIGTASEEDLEAWAENGKTGLLLCDVGNDHNIGAIVRSAAFFDASLVILAESEARGSEESDEVRLTTSAYRVAEGGMEHVEFRTIRNPGTFLRSASKRLITIGTDPRARVRISDLPLIIRERGAERGFGKNPGVILVLGNEETGLPGNVKDQCSILARVPGTGAIESLNVAQAASLFLHELYER
jgi:TrmH RNA methyltransferase